jgi:hypothetical protein
MKGERMRECKVELIDGEYTMIEGDFPFENVGKMWGGDRRTKE